MDALDFEGGKRTYEVTVEVRDSRDDSGNSDTATDDTIDVTINVQSVNEPPVLTGTTTVDYLENGTGPVATYTATDPEGHTPINLGPVRRRTRTYSQSHGGELSFVTVVSKLRSTDTLYLVTVEASDGTSTSSLERSGQHH